MALSDDLRSFWKFNETSGTRFDSSGANNLLEVGSPPIPSAAGILDLACDITPSPIEHFEIFNQNNLAGGARDFTVAGWFFLDDISVNRRICAKWNTTQGREYVITYIPTGPFLQFGVRNSTNTASVAVNASTPVITTGTWFFFAARHDFANSLIRLRLNGTDATPVAFSGGTFTGATKFTVGSLGRSGATTEDPGSIINGRVDHLGFWARHLTDAELTQLFGGGAPPDFPFPPPAQTADAFRGIFFPLTKGHVLADQKLVVTVVGSITQGSRLSAEQVLGDAFNRATSKMRVIEVAGPSSDVTRLDPTLIWQRVHDPDAHAIRVAHNGVSSGASGSRLDYAQILQEVFDPTINALRISNFLSSGGTLGSRLSPTQVLQDIYDVSTGLRMSL